MEIELEELSVVEIARRELGVSKLPETIRNMLNTIYQKKAKNSKYFKQLVVEKAAKTYRTSYCLKKGTQNSVFNIIVLWVLSNKNTNAVKKLLDEYSITSKHYAQAIDNLLSSGFMALLCLGVRPQQFESIKQKLNDPKFNLFTEKLPLPFDNLSPILLFSDESIEWEKYVTAYRQAEDCFNSADAEQAKQFINSITNDKVRSLPIIKALEQKIDNEIKEIEDIFNYIQKKLN